MKRIIRDRHLTPEEAERYNAIRAQVAKDFPPAPTESELNVLRADQAFDAIKQFTDFKIEPRTELETYIPDMLANIMHLCDRDGIDFEDSLRRGRNHYDEEREDN